MRQYRWVGPRMEDQCAALYIVALYRQMGLDRIGVGQPVDLAFDYRNMIVVYP